MAAYRRLVLIRHAHRDTEVHSLDNGLSEKGKVQAKRVAKYFEQFLKDEKVQLLTSPKKRCQETIAPLAKDLKATVTIDPRLVETAAFEADSDLRDRIQSFISDWKTSKDETWIICSHGDWIPKLIHEMFNVFVPLKKAGFVIVEGVGKEDSMTWLCQKVPD